MKLIRATSLLASLTLLAALYSQTAEALDLAFLRDSAVQDFAQEDLAMLKNSLNEALQHPAETWTSQWKNEGSGNSGEVIALSPFTQDSQRCREIKITNRSTYRLGKGLYSLCQDAKGSWNVAAHTSFAQEQH